MAQIKMQNVTKRYGSFLAVDHIDLSVENREFLVLVGPSGCGKSTTLRMIAGLEDVTEGKIYIGDIDVTFLPPKERDIAMVFQNYALYPHMNVYKNMSFGLQIQKFPKKEIDERVKEAAAILGIEDLIDRKPKELSGGQRQRVAMGRAIVRKPQAFLFDEPLSNLDAKLRVQMRSELAKLHYRLQKTVVYVTHDQIEAMTLATRIVVMNQGQIMQIGQPLEVYNHPQNLFVAGFIGSPAMNLLQAKVLQKDDKIYVQGRAFELAIPETLKERFQKLRDTDVVFGIRPEHITYGNEIPQYPGCERLQVTVDVSECIGSETILITSCGPDSITACVGPQCSLGPDSQTELTVDMNRMYLFDKTTGESY
jgi:multiple sugar transport system ATP-binding protein